MDNTTNSTNSKSDLLPLDDLLLLDDMANILQWACLANPKSDVVSSIVGLRINTPKLAQIISGLDNGSINDILGMLGSDGRITTDGNRDKDIATAVRLLRDLTLDEINQMSSYSRKWLLSDILQLN